NPNIRSFRPTGLRKRLSPGSASCMMTIARLLPRLGRIRVLLNAVLYPISQLRRSLLSITAGGARKSATSKRASEDLPRWRVGLVYCRFTHADFRVRLE